MKIKKQFRKSFDNVLNLYRFVGGQTALLVSKTGHLMIKAVLIPFKPILRLYIRYKINRYADNYFEQLEREIDLQNPKQGENP